MFQRKPGNWIALGIAFALFSACGGSGSTSGSPSTGAARGESCRYRADCAKGLACVNKVCSLDATGLLPTGKECVMIDCAVPTDCCPPQPSNCDSLAQACKSGDSFSCQQYQQLCACDAQHWACEADHCTELCQTSADCSQGNCILNKCVECGSDTDCPSSMSCKAQKCVPKCTDNQECEYFHQCIGGTCVETGCSTDRECIAATANVLAVCRNTECKVPCESDVQCVQPNSEVQACIGGFCVSIGCETDEECRIWLNVPAGKGPEAVCRAKTTP